MTLAKKFSLSALAVAVALPGAALADAHEPSAMNSGRVTPDALVNLMQSSNLVGGTVYTMVGEVVMPGEDWTATTIFNEIDAVWETLGTVEDVVLSRDGQLTGFVVEEASFLGFGSDSVLLEMSALRMVDDGSGNIAWVTNITEEQFETMPEVEDNWF